MCHRIDWYNTKILQQKTSPLKCWRKFALRGGDLVSPIYGNKVFKPGWNFEPDWKIEWITDQYSQTTALLSIAVFRKTAPRECGRLITYAGEPKAFSNAGLYVRTTPLPSRVGRRKTSSDRAERVVWVLPEDIISSSRSEAMGRWYARNLQVRAFWLGSKLPTKKDIEKARKYWGKRLPPERAWVK